MADLPWCPEHGHSLFECAVSIVAHEDPQLDEDCVAIMAEFERELDEEFCQYCGKPVEDNGDAWYTSSRQTDHKDCVPPCERQDPGDH